ncbi:MAG: HD domain-containing phosphohydrolase [Gammaproteobacteria bacterium]
MSSAEQLADIEATPAALGVLFVDDEQNILASLRRLVRPQGYRVFIAASGAEGLEIIERESIDLVVSDMRMPGMDGAAFLAAVAQRRPDTVRILLTGYSDMASTIDAINKGGIYRYLTKPWEDNDLLLTVQSALKHKALERERDQLLELTRRQNEELKSFNAELEKRVEARTAEIKQTADMLDLAYQELHTSYQTAIPVFANLVEMREGKGSGHGRRVAEMAKTLAQHLGLGEEAALDVYYAGLLHDIGAIGLPDRLVDKPLTSMSPQDRVLAEKHPQMGESALLALEPMAGAARLIRAHHERFDGRGFPDKLIGENIPLGARILAVVNEYDGLQRGTLFEDKLNPEQAAGFLKENSFKRYDPTVVEAFLKLLNVRAQKSAAARRHINVGTSDLRTGQVLARDLINHDNILLLTKGYRMTEAMIGKMRAYESDCGVTLQIYVFVAEGTDL